MTINSDAHWDIITKSKYTVVWYTRYNAHMMLWWFYTIDSRIRIIPWKRVIVRSLARERYTLYPTMFDLHRGFMKIKAKWNFNANQTKFDISCISHRYGLFLLYYILYFTPYSLNVEYMSLPIPIFHWKCSICGRTTKKEIVLLDENIIFDRMAYSYWLSNGTNSIEYIAIVIL